MDSNVRPLFPGPRDGRLDGVLQGKFSHVVDDLVVEVGVVGVGPLDTGLPRRGDHTPVVVGEGDLPGHGEGPLVEGPGSHPAAEVRVGVEGRGRLGGGSGNTI